MGLSQRKTKNYLRLGIKKTRLMNGNARGARELKGSRKTKTLLLGRRVRRKGCGDGG